MLGNILSEPVYLDGLQKYLAKFSYGNAHTDDLWAVLTEVNFEFILVFAFIFHNDQIKISI